MVIRVLVVAAAAAAVTGAVLMRSWDRAAGKRVAELKTARLRDEWRADERIAELEMDLDESRELRTALEAKLRAKRTELSRLRNEHAELLRRYATAETERASALEGRRLLALEAAPAGKSPTADALRDGKGAPTPEAYAKADKALTELMRNAARQQAGNSPADEGGPSDTSHSHRAVADGVDPGEAQGSDSQRSGEGADSRSRGSRRNAVKAARRHGLEKQQAEEEHEGKRPAAAGKDAEPRTAATHDIPHMRGRRRVPVAAAVVPYTPLRRPSAEGGFDFFGTQAAGVDADADGECPEPDADAVPAPDEDLADVVGAEALAEHEAELAGKQAEAEAEADEAEAEVHPADAVDAADDAHGGAGAGEVIDLTEHDETEQIDVRQLRARSS
ncbi:hypothetical protein [Streptomyces sp. KR80]|uniref:hypothetical protein n=1 Tax=Streptomyces sp. KR80 TaxID=3457426 RepID=UPI003FD052F5